MQDIHAFTDRVTGAPLSGTDVSNIINRKLGQATKVGAAIRVVDSLLAPVPCMPDGSNDISLLVLSPDAAISHDSTRAVHRDIKLTLYDPEYIPGMSTWPFPFNPFEHFLHVSQRLTCAGMSIEVPLGYYTMLWPQAAVSSGRRYFAWQGTDLTELVNRQMISDYTVTKGYAGGYRGAILDALEVAAVPKSLGGTGQTPQGNDLAGPGIPRALVSIPDAANVDVEEDQFWPAGTFFIDMVNDLLTKGLNFYPLTPLSTPYAVENGQPVLGPIMGAFPRRKFSDVMPSEDWDYSNDPDSSIIEAPLSEEVNSLLSAGARNIIRIIGGQAADGSDLGALRMNSNPASAFSISNLRGLSGGPRALPYFENQSKATTQTAVELYADLMLEQGSQVTQKLSANSLYNPLHGDRDLLIFKITDRLGNVVIDSDATALFEETGWSLPLKATGARMSHVMERVGAV